MGALPPLPASPLTKPLPNNPHAPALHLASSRTPSRWVWAPTSLLQPPACSMHVTTIQQASPVNRAFKASPVQLEGGGQQRRALAQPSLPPVCTPHLAWLYGSPWWDGAQTLGMSVGHGSQASSRSCVTSTRRRCG